MGQAGVGSLRYVQYKDVSASFETLDQSKPRRRPGDVKFKRLQILISHSRGFLRSLLFYIYTVIQFLLFKLSSENRSTILSLNFQITKHISLPTVLTSSTRQKHSHNRTREIRAYKLQGIKRLKRGRRRALPCRRGECKRVVRFGVRHAELDRFARRPAGFPHRTTDILGCVDDFENHFCGL